MSDLSNYINEHCKDFDFYINNVNGDTAVFIQMVSKKTECWLDINVASGEELHGLKMLVAEWAFLSGCELGG